ncbi:MAG: hypothetical protein KDE34_23600 [Anaerolineales bacterium]|nr:hypothetical protein [Anaerolineales bacterium]
MEPLQQFFDWLAFWLTIHLTPTVMAPIAALALLMSLYILWRYEHDLWRLAVTASYFLFAFYFTALILGIIHFPHDAMLARAGLFTLLINMIGKMVLIIQRRRKWES